jgi:hypothetical protein
VRGLAWEQHARCINILQILINQFRYCGYSVPASCRVSRFLTFISIIISPLLSEYIAEFVLGASINFPYLG